MRQGVAATLMASVVAASSAVAQPDASTLTRDFSERLISALVSSGTSAFFDTLLAESYLGRLEETRRAIEDSRPRYARELGERGRPQGHEYVAERWFAPSVVSQCYTVLYERTPLFFSFRFYRSAGEWRLVYFGFHSLDRIREWDCSGMAPVSGPR